MSQFRERTPWGLTDFHNHVYFVSTIDVPISTRKTLREHWREHFPDMVRWFDGPAPMRVHKNGSGVCHLWVKDSWLNQ